MGTQNLEHRPLRVARVEAATLVGKRIGGGVSGIHCLGDHQVVQLGVRTVNSSQNAGSIWLKRSALSRFRDMHSPSVV